VTNVRGACGVVCCPGRLARACNSHELVLYGVRKRWNCNDVTSMCERLTGELHTKLLRLVAVAVAVRVPVTAHVGPIGGGLGPLMRTWAR